MLRAVNDLKGYAILATDGPIGHVADVLFDDRHWAIRYLVVDTGTWLSGRKVLISPMSLGHPDWMLQQIPVSLAKKRVENSPDVDTQLPVSRQHEVEQLAYYGYPAYWDGLGLWGAGAYPGTLAGMPVPASMENDPPASAANPSAEDSHLRSCAALVGYQIVATDGDLGHVENFLLDDETWAIRYFIVNTSNWWGGHHVLVAPQWVERVSWEDSTVTLDLSRDAIKSAPPYDASALFDRQQEQAMYEHYGRPRYWVDDPTDV
jgi:sporulation protein YlmC with PRC-barrel domain